jgi:predicted RNA-binding Zn-ribbon protein involved in translation (DUF1610 family)
MFLKEYKEKNLYVRSSKTGKDHIYSREKTYALFACDNCGEEFSRDLKHMDRKRLSDNYFHCCSGCDAKRFAQRKGVERKKIWDMPASLDWPVSKY